MDNQSVVSAELQKIKVMDIKDYRWLLRNRNLIQQLILKLFNYQNENEFEKKERIKSNVYLSLVGIVFCLWRAVFLYQATSKTKFERAKELLIQLIETNAVNFSDEKKMQDWTFRYYLNNAYFRIELILKKRPNIINKIKRDNFKELKNELLSIDEDIHNDEKCKVIWEEAYKITKEILTFLEKNNI
jgi:hypothetical protein